MNKPPFFPDPVFGWSFFAALMVLLCAAAVVDLRTARIPKILTITIVITGLMVNIARGYCLGNQNRETWQLGAGSSWIGIADGFLFSLTGLALAFVVFFGMFILGSCGGGDVKLCTGIGAWIGATNTLFLLLVSVVALVVWIGGRILMGGMSVSAPKRSNKASTKKERESGSLPRRQMTFSVPAAVSAAIVMLWAFRVDLQLVSPAPEQESNHAMVVPANV